MNQDLFIQKHQGEWSRLESASALIEKRGLRRYGALRARSFLQDFRNASHHLAYARTHYPDSDLTRYLNSLVGKCQTHVYAVEKIAPKAVWHYLTWGYPNTLIRCRGFVLAAFLVFMAGAALGLALTWNDIGNAVFFLPDGLVESVRNGTAGSGQWNYPLMSSLIMTNNIRVALLAFVAGITLGLGTLYILFFNGALLGALTAVIYRYGNPLDFWSLILPHGVLELTAIFIAGASGLLMARGILLPGELSRRHSAIRGALQAVSLLFGTALMLVIAGIIEGFFTPQPIDPWLKLTFAGVSGLLLVLYVGLGAIRPSSGS